MFFVEGLKCIEGIVGVVMVIFCVVVNFYRGM